MKERCNGRSILNRLFEIREELEQTYGLSFDDALFEAVNHAVDLASRWQQRGLIPEQEQDMTPPM